MGGPKCKADPVVALWFCLCYYVFDPVITFYKLSSVW